MGKLTAACGFLNLSCCFFSKKLPGMALGSYCFLWFTTRMLKLLFFWQHLRNLTIFYNWGISNVCTSILVYTFILLYYINLWILMFHPTQDRGKIMYVTKNNHNLGYMQLADLCLMKVKPQIKCWENDKFSIHNTPVNSSVEQYIHLHLSLLTCSLL